MSHKEQHGNKESKKTPAHSAKEKKQLKRAKKHDKGATPLLPPHH
jgi:hypothetical protein